MNANELIELIRENQVIIYGDGYVALRFFELIKNLGVSDKVECFVTSQGSNELIDGKKIYALPDMVCEEYYYLIAVHESNKDEIICNLVENNCAKYIWIYPYLYELMLGEPVANNVVTNISNIFEASKKSLAFAFRYLAIDEYYKKNNYGYETYIECMNLYNTPETSARRLNAFIKLIRSYDKRGFDNSVPVSILDNNKCIDGMHRISIASYHNQKSIICNVYSAQDIERVHSDECLLNIDNIHHSRLNKNTIDRLLYMNQCINERYGYMV